MCVSVCMCFILCELSADWRSRVLTRRDEYTHGKDLHLPNHLYWNVHCCLLASRLFHSAEVMVLCSLWIDSCLCLEIMTVVSWEWTEIVQLWLFWSYSFCQQVFGTYSLAVLNMLFNPFSQSSSSLLLISEIVPEQVLVLFRAGTTLLRSGFGTFLFWSWSMWSIHARYLA